MNLKLKALHLFAHFFSFKLMILSSLAQSMNLAFQMVLLFLPIQLVPGRLLFKVFELLFKKGV
jgi:hypothetical protein